MSIPHPYAYSEIVERYKALIGVDALSTEDQSALKRFVNGRARIAHERYPFPDFTIIGEHLPLGTGNSVVLKNNSGIPSSDATLFHEADIIYRIHKKEPRLHKIDDFGEEWKFYYIRTGLNDLTAVIQKGDSSAIGDVYVTYRRELVDYINDGTATSGQFGSEATDNNEVPHAIASYLVHGSYADFLKSDGQASKAMQEEANAERVLQSAIDKYQNQSRGFRNDIIEYRPSSQFQRHNRTAGGQPIVQSANDVQ